MESPRLRSFYASLVGIGLLALSSSAHALFVDFTDDIWQGNEPGDTASTKTRMIDSVVVTVIAYSDFDSATTDTLTFTNFDGNAANVPCGVLLECDTDGAGIDDDEVSYGIGSQSGIAEMIRVILSEPIDLGRIHVLDLYAAPDGPDGSNGGSELAEFMANTGDSSSLIGTAAWATGGYAVTNDLGWTNVSVIDFFVNSPPTNSDFAVAAIEMKVTRVPEPGTIAMLGVGLLSLAAFARRRLVRSR